MRHDRPPTQTAAQIIPPVAGGDEPTTDHPSLFPFLQPAQEPNELGRLANYRVLRLIGQGGMGMVFEAEDEALRRRVALKVMKAEVAADRANRERFLREARAAAALTGEYVATVFQVGVADDTPFLAMEFLQGESLQDRLERASPLPVREALVVARQAAAGLAEAHAAGLVHRDIKPANLWLQAGPDGRFKRVRILDFGLAAYAAGSRPAEKLTSQGVVVGTPHYMSPEQAGGRPLDGRSDLFSLGAVLYTALTGECAFDGNCLMAVITALVTTHPPPVSEKNPVVPQSVSDLVGRLLAKKPADRPAGAAAVVEAIDRLLATDLPAAAGPSAHARSAPAYDTLSAAARDTLPAADGDSAKAAAAPPRRRPPTDWKFLALTGLAGWVALALIMGVAARARRTQPLPGLPDPLPGEPIRVGVLWSQTGTMSLSESPVIDAALLAVEEVNEAGGVLGRTVEAVVADGQSDPAVFAEAAERLLAKDRVTALFGCWTSASRKAVRPVVERNDGLLFYPVQFEGLADSPRIVYLGPTANQQIFPALDFLCGKLGKKRLFLVGSDYVYPRAAGALIRGRVADHLPGVEVVGEAYLPLGTKDVAGAVAALTAAKPDAVVNMLNGGTNYQFFRALRAAGVASAAVPTLSVSVGENQLFSLDPAVLAGDYLAASYFMSVDRPESRAFIRNFRARYGQDRPVTDPMAAAYSAVHLWAQSANAAATTDPPAVLAALPFQTFAGPRCDLRVDGPTRYAWLPCWVGRIRPDGGVELVGGSADPIRPIPFPPGKTRAQWERFLVDLHEGWDGHWQAPAVP